MTLEEKIEKCSGLIAEHEVGHAIVSLALFEKSSMVTLKKVEDWDQPGFGEDDPTVMHVEGFNLVIDIEAVKPTAMSAYGYAGKVAEAMCTHGLKSDDELWEVISADDDEKWSSGDIERRNAVDIDRRRLACDLAVLLIRGAYSVQNKYSAWIAEDFVSRKVDEASYLIRNLTDPAPIPVEP